MTPRSLSWICLVSLCLCACAGSQGTRPVPPTNLDLRLEGNYPLLAIGHHRSGDALVAFAVETDGRVVITGVTRDSGPEFGQACIRMLLETRWTPATDEEGKPVRAEAAFRCQFEARGSAPAVDAAAPTATQSSVPQLNLTLLQGLLVLQDVIEPLRKFTPRFTRCLADMEAPSIGATHMVLARITPKGSIAETLWSTNAPQKLMDCGQWAFETLTFPPRSGSSVMELQVVMPGATPSPQP